MQFTICWLALVPLLASSTAAQELAFERGEPEVHREKIPAHLRGTVLQGRVVGSNGSPAQGSVVVSSAGGRALTDADGCFELAIELAVPTEHVQITAIQGSGSRGSLASVSVPVRARAANAVPLLTLQQGTSCQPSWLPTFNEEISGSIFALAVFDDGNGPALYAGGDFIKVGGAFVRRIARWDGTSWSALGMGVSSTVRALEVFDDGNGPALYAGGDFENADGLLSRKISRWDGTGWSSLGTGLNSTVRALEVFDDGGGAGPALYVGGDFTDAGGVTVDRMAKWDGTTWAALGSGMSGPVHALTVFDTGQGSGPALYAGGDFALAGGLSVWHIAKWNGTSWSSLGAGMNDAVRSLQVFDDGRGAALYAGGIFTLANGVLADRIARWDGSSWSALGAGLNGEVSALQVFDDGGGPALHAGGSFDSAGGAFAPGVALWDGSSWSPLGSGVGGGPVYALAVFDDGSGAGSELHIGGNFSTAGEVPAHSVAKWDGASWQVLLGDHLLGGPVQALAVFDDGAGPALYAGGEFLTAGSGPANHIAKWDGTQWSPLGSGTNDYVMALAAFEGGSGSGPRLIAGGWFTEAGGAPASRIAIWDGTSWSPLGSGLNGPVFALKVFGERGAGGPALYAGGNFTMAGVAPASNVARWNGASWSALGSGTSGTVQALEIFDDSSGAGLQLYAAGSFTSAGVPVSNIAKWDGTSWSPLGSGVSGGFPSVRALAVFDDGVGRPSLYAGGHLTMAGGMTARRIAKWDGVSWSPVGEGMTGPAPHLSAVHALEVFDDGSGSGPALYAAGTFSNAGGLEANSIARWDGSSWSELGGGIADELYTPVNALETWHGGGGSALYAGGDFATSAVGDVFLAKWAGCPRPGAGTPFCFGVACPCGNDDALAGCAHSGGSGALLEGSGTASVSADDLVLLVSSAPANQFGILYMGGAQMQAPFGDGQRCVAPGPFAICRFAVQPTGAGGTFGEGPGLVAFSLTQPPACHVDPGETWYFQGWFRDPAGPCGNGLNLTNGLAIAFLP